jgi:hypothetical protein
LFNHKVKLIKLGNVVIRTVTGISQLKIADFYISTIIKKMELCLFFCVAVKLCFRIWLTLAEGAEENVWI